MISKINLVLIVFIVIFVSHAFGRPTNEGQKKVRCFRPSKPHDMPQDVYDKYKISSKHLAEQDKKDFWQKFANWWKNVFEQIGQFFQKVGQFFKNLFKPKNAKEAQTTNPPTEPPPTPDPGRTKTSEDIVCVEYEDSTDSSQSTQGNPPTSSLKTTINDLTTPEVTTNDNSNKMPESTPYEPNGEKKDKIPVVVGMEEKVNNVKKNHNSDATVVRDV